MSLCIRRIITAFAAWTERKKRCRWRCRPNFVPSKAVVLLLLIHSLMFLPLGCRGSVFGPRFVMHYLARFAISRWETESKIPTLLSVLWLFLTVPWIGLKYVIVILLDHTRYHFNELVHQKSGRKGSVKFAQSRQSLWKSHWKFY